MSRCSETREILDAYTVGLGTIEALDQDHIRDCDECSAAVQETETLRQALRVYAQEIDRQADHVFAERHVPGSGAETQPFPRFRPTYRWLMPLFGMAAVFAIFAIITVLRERPTPVPARQHLYVKALEQESARDEIMSYLDRSQSLVLTLMDKPINCQGGRIEIGIERKLAQDLIFQKKLLDAPLQSLRHQEFKSLCDDLELLFLDVASSETCISPEKMQLWQHVLESRATLMKMNLLRTEGRT